MDGKDDLIAVDCPPCVGCGERARLMLPPDRVLAWREGGYVQNVFPEMSPDNRELLISGTHPQCWDKLFFSKNHRTVGDRRVP